MLAAQQYPIEASGVPTAASGEAASWEDAPWEEALCRDGAAGMVGLFFSEAIEDIATAKAICAGCPLAGPCLEGALERGEPWGVWGGQLFADGRILAFKRKRGRPPKSAQRPDIAEPVRLTA